MLDLVEAVLTTLDVHDRVDYELVRRDQHSNHLIEVHFTDGRVLAIKHARLPEMASRFWLSRLASRLIRERGDVVAPVYLDVPDETVGEPILAYWWLDNPTLAETWAEPARPQLRSWGRMLARLHRIGLAGHGPLEEAVRKPQGLRGFLEADLRGRLLPAAVGPWPQGVGVLEALAAAAEHLPEAPAVLVHNDLFDANVLCDIGDAGEIVGVLDLEDCIGGPREADLAKTEILHGPLFGHPLHGDWFASLVDGYGRQPDPVLRGFFRAHAMANMAWYAAVTDRGAHAAQLARVIAAELDALGADRTHVEVVGV